MLGAALTLKRTSLAHSASPSRSSKKKHLHEQVLWPMVEHPRRAVSDRAGAAQIGTWLILTAAGERLAEG